MTYPQWKAGVLLLVAALVEAKPITTIVATQFTTICPTTIESTGVLSTSTLISTATSFSVSSNTSTTFLEVSTSLLATSASSSDKLSLPVLHSTTTKPAISSPSSSFPLSTRPQTTLATIANPTSTSSSTSDMSSISKTSTAPVSLPTVNRLYPADVVDKLRDSSMSKLGSWLQKNPPSSGCTLENAVVRREFSDLSVEERQEYIGAVKCLQSASPKSPVSLVPGARTRYDDFVATHINQTDWIHNTANFLSWHRYYLWTYEKALREECGYTGAHPYWNWDRYAADPANSPLFNGNASSMSSGSSRVDACVDSGPFADLVVNLGPGKSLRSNPRCLVRNLSASQASQCTADKTLRLITGSSDISSFQNTMQAIPGVHAGGHFTIGGNPGSDIYASPGDPAFFLHHGMIDRVWWLWQIQNLDTRLEVVAGSNARAGGLGKLSDIIDLGINAGPTTLSTLQSTMGGLDGEMCYVYA